MNGMDLIFPLTPLTVRALQPLRVKHFYEMLKNAKNWPILLSAETQLLAPLFSNSCHSKIDNHIDLKQGQMKLRIPNVHNMKESYWYLKHHIQVWKLRPSCRCENQDVFPCQARFPWCRAFKIGAWQHCSFRFMTRLYIFNTSRYTFTLSCHCTDLLSICLTQNMNLTNLELHS